MNVINVTNLTNFLGLLSLHTHKPGEFQYFQLLLLLCEFVEDQIQTDVI